MEGDNDAITDFSVVTDRQEVAGRAGRWVISRRVLLPSGLPRWQAGTGSYPHVSVDRGWE